MLELPLSSPPAPERGLDMPGIMRTISVHSARPRYTFMVLDLIARVAGRGGAAGPMVRDGEQLVPIREWLSAAIAPSAARHHYRKATVEAVRRDMAERGLLPPDAAQAQQLVDMEVADRVRISGMTSVSRAVSELVKAGLVTRHYQGFRVDHHNRGAQRHAVYTVPAQVLAALARGQVA
ncbi:hypothetical protein EDF56_11092 [Novosphingobium sp. PhB165]|uniref:hypothetical protein n=1 Tax=Novosphingobium sp. PhB165 TaxID=2485105 RepID=UPI00104E6557|nr:hypothetical protein [Novosphingobium sp. PhB165]TCM15412.1 hypothetical protein EDF56_11092 [Novosphingobium sp. PhB165]